MIVFTALKCVLYDIVSYLFYVLISPLFNIKYFIKCVKSHKDEKKEITQYIGWTLGYLICTIFSPIVVLFSIAKKRIERGVC